MLRVAKENTAKCEYQYILSLNEANLKGIEDILTPEESYEERGFVPNVCFPCPTIHDPESGKIAIYYGCADSYVGLAFCYFDEIVAYIKEHSVTRWDDTDIGRR